MRKVALPSGKELTVDAVTFADAKELFQAVGFFQASLKEMNGLDIPEKKITKEVFKHILTASLCFPMVDKCVWKCFEKCLYDDVRITPDTFEPVEARGDYLTCCLEVALENTLPFLPSLESE